LLVTNDGQPTTNNAVKNILVTGATGQIGSELVPALRARYGGSRVVAAGHARQPDRDLAAAGPYLSLDVRDQAAIRSAVAEHRIETVMHLASLLSAAAEAQSQLAWDINVNGLINVLEAARERGCAVFFPSSIAAFGPLAPAENTPQDTIQRPSTIYGITKVTGELLCDYYHRRYGVDTRGLRYPGLISSKTLPGGGTTDYAVHVFYAALKDRRYECFLKPDTRLDLMYMPDAIRATIELMEADGSRLVHRNAYNLTAMSVTPHELADAITQRIPDFTISYAIDPVRQAIADSWPRHMDDRAAREEWGWRPLFDLAGMVDDMLDALSARHE
jgi:nucleoside-diphosphate-sugar epimerase